MAGRRDGAEGPLRLTLDGEFAGAKVGTVEPPGAGGQRQGEAPAGRGAAGMAAQPVRVGAGAPDASPGR
jgi:hypothetical protein